MRLRNRRVVAPVLLAVFVVVGHVAAQDPASRPNVIVVLTDDQGYGDFGIHGNEKIRTPNLDRFAAGGVRVERFYTSPVCAPTRASFLTGRYYYRSGVIHTSRGAAKMDTENLTLAEILRDAGYRTGIFGKWHLGDNYPMRPQDQGFEEVLVHKSGGIGQSPDKGNKYFDSLLWKNGAAYQAKGYCTDVFTDHAIEFMKQNRERPFFLYLATNTPHTPLQVADRYWLPYRKKGFDERNAKILGMIENIDENFGRLESALDSLELREKTLVIFFCDNGPNSSRYTAGLRGEKAKVYEGGIRSACFIQWPEKLRGGQQREILSAHIDLAPTILEACGVAAPVGHEFDGRSFLGNLINPQSPVPDRELVFQCHRGMQPKPYQQSAVVTQRYKLVGYPGTFRHADFTTSTTNPILELYDLESDPAEEKDIARDNPEIVARLRRAYDAWFKSVESSRNFTPGWIHVGSDAEDPVLLCKYQDASKVGEVQIGWPIRILHAGRYEVTVEHEYLPQDGRPRFSFNGEELEPVAHLTRARAVIKLPAAEGTFNVWYDKPPEATANPKRDTVGNVRVRKL